MKKESLTILKLSLYRVANLVENIPDAHWFEWLDGFPNNIAWNVGHIMLVQQRILYGRSGLAMHVPEAYQGLYGAGTSPADWEMQPDIKELLELLKVLPGKIEADVERGLFESIEYETLGIGNGAFPFTTAAEGVHFVAWHDGIHIGVIGSILDVLKHGK